MKRFSFLFSCLALLLLASPAFSQNFPDGTKYVDTDLISDHSAVPFLPGVSEPVAYIGVRFEIEPGWHIYWKNSGEAASPTTIEWKVPEGMEVGELQWPAPLRFRERGDITTYGYQNEVLLYAPVTWSSSSPLPEGDLQIEAEVSWLVCKDICVPGRRNITGTLKLATDTAGQKSPDASLFEQAAAQVPLRAAQQKYPPDAAPKILFSHSPTAPKQSLSAAVFLPGLPVQNAKEAAAGVQIFPFASDIYEIGGPAAAVVNGEKPAGAVVRFPVRIKSSASPGNHPFTIVLAAKNDGTEAGITALELEAELNVAEGEPLPQESYDELLDGASEFEPLMYRRVSYDEVSTVEASAAGSADPISAKTLLWAIVSAFIGGMLLNLMPCVLPIISIKVMGFLGAAEHTRREGRRAAFAFSAGILCSFLALALIVIALRAGGYQTGWGFQFQHPSFVVGLTLIVFVLSLGFFDLYTVALPYLNSANRLVGNLNPSLFKHFFDGVLATALSTPCTAPFLGVALIVAFSQSAAITIAIFLSVGLGLAIPYAWLTTHPALLNRLPKPGAWMYRVRQFMGFCLLGTVVWLLFVLHRLTEEGVIWLLLGMLIIYFLLWVKEWAKEVATRRTHKFAIVAALVLSVVYTVKFFPLMTAPRSGTSVSSSGSSIAWQPYSPSLVEELRGNGSPVFIDFTADWCITCKANEFLVIETQEVQKKINDLGIVPVKADWTAGDETITAALKQYGGEGVPLYVVLPANTAQAPIVLPTLLSRSGLINAFKQASISKAQ